MGYLKGKSWLLASLGGLLTCIGLATAADTPAQAANQDRHLCYLDGKKNSLGAMVTIDHKAWRCTSVLEERGVPGTAWVQVRMSATLVAE